MAVVLALTGHDAVGDVPRDLRGRRSPGTARCRRRSISATPILFTGLAAAAAFRMQLFNIGAEGQLYLGAIGASWIALQLGDRDVTSTPLFVVAMCVAARVARRALGVDPGCPPSVRAHERDHHLADAQLRGGPAPHVPDLRQLVLLARHVDAPGPVVPAGQADARGVQLADLRLVGRRPARVPHRARRRARRVGAVLAHAVRVRGGRDRRLAARGALRGHAHPAEDPRGHGPLGCDRRHRRREPDRRLHVHARRQPDRLAGRGVRLHGHRRRRARALQPARRLPRRGAHRRAPERRLHAAGAGLPVRARGRDAGDHPLLRARRRAAPPLPAADHAERAGRRSRSSRPPRERQRQPARHRARAGGALRDAAPLRGARRAPRRALRSAQPRRRGDDAVRRGDRLLDHAAGRRLERAVVLFLAVLASRRSPERRWRRSTHSS